MKRAFCSEFSISDESSSTYVDDESEAHWRRLACRNSDATSSPVLRRAEPSARAGFRLADPRSRRYDFTRQSINAFDYHDMSSDSDAQLVWMTPPDLLYKDHASTVNRTGCEAGHRGTLDAVLVFGPVAEVSPTRVTSGFWLSGELPEQPDPSCIGSFQMERRCIHRTRV